MYLPHDASLVDALGMASTEEKEAKEARVRAEKNFIVKDGFLIVT